MDRTDEDRATALVGQLVTIYRCSECGRWEGERSQAGCCPGCGQHSTPEPFIVEVVGPVVV